MKRYKVQLTTEEREQLQKLISSGVATARKLTRARVLLRVDTGMTKTKISQVLDVTNNTVANVCRTFQIQRLEAIERKEPDREYGHSLDGEAEAYLAAIACSRPPEGRERWALRMLQAEMVKRNPVDEGVPKLFGQPLKNELKPWLKESWCISPKANAAFVCQMGDVLDVFKRTYDPKRPQICMDEMPKQLLAEKYEPLSSKPGQLEKQDYEYERHGNANIFILFEPLAGKRFIETHSHRKSVDWAHVMKDLSDVNYPNAEVIVLVMDNLFRLTEISYNRSCDMETIIPTP